MNALISLYIYIYIYINYNILLILGIVHEFATMPHDNMLC